MVDRASIRLPPRFIQWHEKRWCDSHQLHYMVIGPYLERGRWRNRKLCILCDRERKSRLSPEEREIRNATAKARMLDSRKRNLEIERRLSPKERAQVQKQYLSPVYQMVVGKWDMT